MQNLLPQTGHAVRVGITGAPGVGKSTTIDALGTYLTGQGHKVAVLAVDPSSARTGGSILADKTRMARLAADPNAFVRPSPASGTLGGVAAKTRESMLICEAAGYDVVLVETIGTGQSETVVADMTDFFLVLMLPGAGDELQGLKKGVVELADMIAVNKADGDNIKRAKAAAAEYRAALHILTPRSSSWTPPVVTYSALTGDGIDRSVDDRPRSSRAADQGRRARGAPARAAGQVDVGDARGARVRAAQVGCGAEGEAAEARGRGRRGPDVASRGGRRDRRGAGRVMGVRATLVVALSGRRQGRPYTGSRPRHLARIDLRHRDRCFHDDRRRQRQREPVAAGQHLPLRGTGEIVRPFRRIAAGPLELPLHRAPMLVQRGARQLVRHVLGRQPRHPEPGACRWCARRV